MPFTHIIGTATIIMMLPQHVLPCGGPLPDVYDRSLYNLTIPNNATRKISGETTRKVLQYGGTYTFTCTFSNTECVKGIFFIACDQNCTTRTYVYNDYISIEPKPTNDITFEGGSGNDNTFNVQLTLKPVMSNHSGTYQCFTYNNITNIVNITKQVQVTLLGSTYVSRSLTNKTIYNVSCSFNDTFPGNVILIVSGGVNTTIVHNDTVQRCGQNLFWGYKVHIPGGSPSFQCTINATECPGLTSHSRLWSNTTTTPGPPVPAMTDCTNYSHPWWTTTARPATTTFHTTSTIVDLITQRLRANQHTITSSTKLRRTEGSLGTCINNNSCNDSMVV
uniref:SPLF1 glycoprotein n=1 Tax=Simian cytomegalovirus (strain Colburn) TaxID=50292 RepID=Q9QC01_SCMVC|nr:SPLF1 glycoprotein [Cercopithecine betaherpesvirus 5]